jgi:hypothetical protein
MIGADWFLLALGDGIPGTFDTASILWGEGLFGYFPRNCCSTWELKRKSRISAAVSY